MNIYGFLQRFVSPWCKRIRYASVRVDSSQSCESSKSREMNVLLVEAVKGCHECPFTVRTGEAFSLEKKMGSRGEAFRVVNCDKAKISGLELVSTRKKVENGQTSCYLKESVLNA